MLHKTGFILLDHASYCDPKNEPHRMQIQTTLNSSNKESLSTRPGRKSIAIEPATVHYLQSFQWPSIPKNDQHE